MKRLLHIFVLTPAEQRIAILLMLVLIGAAWLKHRRDVAQPRGTAISNSPSK